MYLEGSAWKWYLCLGTDAPEEWLSTEEVEATDTEDAVEAVEGLRERFLKDFQQGNYRLYQEAKLRARVQGPDECPTVYYYDVLNLCRVVDPAMSEAQKIENLFRGLKPALIEKVYPAKPRKCSDFLSLIKLHSEATIMAKTKDCAINLVTSDDGPDVEFLGYVGRYGSGPTSGSIPKHYTLEEVIKEVLALRAEVAKLSAATVNTGNEHGTWGMSSEHRNENRTSDGRPICFNCERPGHIKRFCWLRKTGEEDGSASSPHQVATSLPTNLVAVMTPEDNQPHTPMSSGTVLQEQLSRRENALRPSAALFRVDLSRLIIEEVVCAGTGIPAVVDTGAAITVISPKLVSELGLVIRPWDGPGVKMANGQQCIPQGAVKVDIETTIGRVVGEIIVMQMDGMDLLLGNDMLAQLGRIIVEYPTKGPA